MPYWEFNELSFQVNKYMEEEANQNESGNTEAKDSMASTFNDMKQSMPKMGNLPKPK